jgi:hypothetical protein
MERRKGYGMDRKQTVYLGIIADGAHTVVEVVRLRATSYKAARITLANYLQGLDEYHVASVLHQADIYELKG